MVRKGTAFFNKNKYGENILKKNRCVGSENGLNGFRIISSASILVSTRYILV